MNAFCPPQPPFPTNPKVGDFFGGWCWNGNAWIPAPPQGVRLVTTVFSAVGANTYTPSPGLVTVEVELVGAGGGGGGVLHTAGWNGGGGGGGSGGYSRSTLDASLVLGGVIVTIGQGGGSTAYPNTAPPQAGSTSFGSLLMAFGGWGGITVGVGAGSPGQTGEGGLPAQIGIGQVALGGRAGHHGSYANVGTVTPPIGAMYGGEGGLAPVIGGRRGRAAVIFAAGFMDGRDAYTNDPQGPGNGGNGGVSWSGGSDCGGGNGGNGLCIVTEYCWIGTSGQPPMDCTQPGCAPIPITDGSCLGWGGGGSWR